MDTLHERLAELADAAPTGGAPAAELWARGKRAGRVRAATLGTAVLVLVVAGVQIGGRLAGGPDDRSDLVSPATADGFALPIVYPVGKALPGLGEVPGPLAAVWLIPRGEDVAPQIVGLVARTGRFGTLPIDVVVYPDSDPDYTYGNVELSPDGRRIAYWPPNDRLLVHDLVSGEDMAWPGGFSTRESAMWVDATTLVGHVADGSDAEGWVWELGTTPRRVDMYEYRGASSYPYLGRDLSVFIQRYPQRCSTPILEKATGRFEVPVLCDVLGAIGSDIVLGHQSGPNDGSVIALDVRGAATYTPGPPPRIQNPQFDDPAKRRVVVNAGAPERVSFATDLIGAALRAASGAS